MPTVSSACQFVSTQLPQLPAFSDTQWLESTIQASDLELISSDCEIAVNSFLWYVIHSCSTDMKLKCK